jgi:hypothetical protein
MGACCSFGCCCGEEEQEQGSISARSTHTNNYGSSNINPCHDHYKSLAAAADDDRVHFSPQLSHDHIYLTSDESLQNSYVNESNLVLCSAWQHNSSCTGTNPPSPSSSINSSPKSSSIRLRKNTKARSRLEEMTSHETQLALNHNLIPSAGYSFPSAIRLQFLPHSLLIYANTHFRPAYSRKTIKKQLTSTSELIEWSGQQLQQPLLNTLLTAEQEKLAVKMFKNILIIMGDYESQVADKTQFNLSTQIIQAALNHMELRDELYVQLMKQLNNNQSLVITSRLSGWKLFMLFTCNFAPSKQLADTLLAFFTNNTNTINNSAGSLSIAVNSAEKAAQQLTDSHIAHIIHNCAVFCYFQSIKTMKGETFNIPTKLYEKQTHTNHSNILSSITVKHSRNNSTNSINSSALSNPINLISGQASRSNSPYLIAANDLFDMEYLLLHAVRLYQFYFSSSIQFQMLLQRSEGIKPSIPLIVHCCIEQIWLHKGYACRGIFKNSCESERLEQLKQYYLQEKLDIHAITNFSDPNLHAALLLSYLHELSEPVIPFELYQHCCNNSNINNLQQFYQFTQLLSLDNKNSFLALIHFFADFSTYSALTGLTLSDLITVFTDELIRLPSLPLQQQLLNLPKLEKFLSNAISLYRNNNQSLQEAVVNASTTAASRLRKKIS